MVRKPEKHPTAHHRPCGRVSKQSTERKSAKSHLQEHGYILVFKPTLVLRDGRVKGNVDAELVLQAMVEYDHYEKAVLVTGDGDFYCLVDYLKKQHKLEKLLIPNQFKYSSLLRNFLPGDAVFMNNLRGKLQSRQ